MTVTFSCASVALLALTFASPVGAQAHAHDAAAGLGTVHFATSCASATSPTFDRAIALLHSFEFRAAIRGFGDALAADSTCAMAHWGIALSRWTNPMAAGLRAPALLAQGRVSSDAAARLAPHATLRERGYIAAVAALYADYEHADQATRVRNYERAMNDLAARNPADTEAKIFHAIAVVAAASPTDKTYAAQLTAGATLESLFRAHPNHPGLAHYIIHSYDVPALAPRANAAATRYATIAPAAAHALHMPSHTFTRLGYWRSSVRANLRSADAARRDSSTAEALHASDYLTYAYLQMGDVDSAKAVLASLPALAARFDPDAVTGAAPGSAGTFALAAIPARYALERGAWSEAAALIPSSTKTPYADAMTWFARSLGASRTGDTATARTSADTLAAIHERLLARGETYWAEQVNIQTIGARAWQALASGARDDALATMRIAVAREDSTEKSAVTPGPLAPARELLGDMLMQLDQPKAALVEYRATLVKEPNRRRTLDGARRAALASGDRASAAQYASKLASLTQAP